MVIVNPAGTRSAPRTRVISATPAPLPPSSSRCSRDPSENAWTQLIARAASSAAPARASSASARLRLASSIISPSSIAAPSPPPASASRIARARSTSSRLGRKLVQRLDLGRVQRPLAVEAELARRALPRRRRPSSVGDLQERAVDRLQPAARAATSTALADEVPARSLVRGWESRARRSCRPEPMISASSRGLAAGDLVHVAQARRRLDQRLEPDRAAPPASASSARLRSRSAARLDLGHDHRVEPRAAPAASAPTSSSNHGVCGRVDAHADRRRRPGRRPRAPRRRPPAPRPSLGRHRVLEVDDDLVGGQDRRLLEHRAGGPGPKGRSAGPSSATSICPRS